MKQLVVPLTSRDGRRPPRGGRGLKLCTSFFKIEFLAVAPRAGGVD